MSKSPTLRAWNLGFGFVGLIMAFVVPIVLIVASIFNHPDMSCSQAECVYDYAIRHGTFSADQLDIISAGVRYAHGHTALTQYLPVAYPILFLVSAIVHFASASASRKRNIEEAEPGATDNPDGAQ